MCEVTRKRLFFDLELSKSIFWAWGTGKQYLGYHQLLEPQKIISFHWNWEGSDKINHVHWGLNKQCDKSVVKEIAKQFNKADEIIAHNGDKFDMKKLFGRAMFHKIELRPKYITRDTMKMVKSCASLPSYSLKFLCKHFDLPLKLDSGGSATWDEVQFKKSKEALDHLLYYGDGDIISLKALFYYIESYVPHKVNYAVLRGGERYECPNCGKLPHYKSMYTTAAGTIQHWMQCSDRKECKTQFKINNKTYMDFLQWKITNGIK